MKIHIAINGACGRMGQRLVALAKEDPQLAVVAALEAPQHPKLGADAGDIAGAGALGVPVSDALEMHTRADVAIDFSHPDATMEILKTCVARRIPLVVATTGHSAAQHAAIKAAAHETAILMSPNMSLVANVLFKLTQTAAQFLKGRGYDVEIVERHHRFKKDAPSGTALYFAKLIQDVLGPTTLRHGREGIVGERPEAEIGMHSIRAGDNFGEHTIIFSTVGETMELVHKAHNRDAYARGALQAAKFLANSPAGHYTMNDVLGL
jgi:4-hydroxy-tetrahydrodipicolinate reductase